MFLLGYDVGSSLVKATVMEAETGKIVVSATAPKRELNIIAEKPGWAEQEPCVWWDNVKIVTDEIVKESKIYTGDIQAIGISYQMHGLVIVDKNYKVLRPAIIWCDSRAVPIGEKATQDLGHERCLENLLNYPGNFTATKLKWVVDNEPKTYDKIYKIMLPGDYIAMKMTGQINTTQSGLSEAILWDFKNKQLAQFALDYFGFSPEIIPDIVPTFAVQGELTKQAAEELGLAEGTKVSYRAGDQPNNALSLNVLNPGEVATTAGTSGVVYGVGDKPNYDLKSRVNTFAHVNYTKQIPRYGVLLCINGTGILNSWLKHNSADSMSYEQMNDLAEQAPVGSDGLVILPFGNGAERTLENQDVGAVIYGLKFNTHNRSHLLRAAQEGIVFAINYGMQIMRDMGVEIRTVRAGNANMFLSGLFGQAFATVTRSVVELYQTDGAQGAARGAGIGAGLYRNFSEAFTGLKRTKVIEPQKDLTTAYKDAYENWSKVLKRKLNGSL